MTPDPPTPDPIPALRRRLLRFFDEERRELPWRGADPYGVWVSEVMLQQTRVETVLPYYRRWMERFPDVATLAEASREEVLQEWKGLGYYARARNLHRAARLVRERFGGALPRTSGELKELPGVGEYTAGAVASIAFEEPVPAVDGNARRVLARLFDLPDPGAAELRERAASLVDPDRPGALNQAVMELGARICTPRSPSCAGCPVEELCLARERGTVNERPAPRTRTAVDRKEIGVAVAVDPEGRTVVRRRPEDGLLGGMWEFPGVELDGAGVGDPAESPARGGVGRDEASTAARAAALEAAEAVGVGAGDGAGIRPLDPVFHAFSHLRVVYRPFVVPTDRAPDVGDGIRVLALERLDEVPLPVAQQEIGRRALELIPEEIR